MTVKELLEHFHIYPSDIEWIDNTIHDEHHGIIMIESIDFEGKEHYDSNAYESFVERYGDREVDNWACNNNVSLYIELGEEVKMINAYLIKYHRGPILENYGYFVTAHNKEEAIIKFLNDPEIFNLKLTNEKIMFLSERYSYEDILDFIRIVFGWEILEIKVLR